MSSVIQEDVGAARILYLNRQDKANALNDDLVEHLQSALTRALDEGRRLLLFAGSGRHFCSGFDLSDYREQSEGDLLLRFIRLEKFLQRVRYAACVTAAYVDGAAFGAGADLAMSCTLRIGTGTARFRFPGSRFGVVLGTRHLAQVIGGGPAREILSCNRTLGADEALSYGLLTQLMPAGGSIEDVLKAVENHVGGLDARTIRQLNEQTMIAGSRYEDMGVLAESLAPPGLHARMDNYMGVMSGDGSRTC